MKKASYKGVGGPSHGLTGDNESNVSCVETAGAQWV